VDFDYSDEQKLLKEQARRYLAQECGSTRVRGIADDPARLYDAALWRGLADLGWLGAAIPEEFGGLGLGRVELCVIAEELGYACAPVPFASTSFFVGEALLMAGSAAQKSRLLPRIASGELVGCIGTAEGPGPVAMGQVAASVQNGRLSGRKIPVVDGASAQIALVLATDEQGPGLFLAQMRTGGVRSESLPTLDPTRGAASVSFNEVPVERLGPAGDGWRLLERLNDRAAVLIAFEQLGGAERCLHMAREHALNRYAFGRKIGSFQAIKHKLADMFVRNELARSHAYYGAWALNSDAPELGRAAAAARVAACEAFWFASRENIHTHGGMGFTWESDCHLFYKRAKHLALVVGAPRVWKERLATHIQREFDGLQ
jgi:alkylation response protein AidB-like acyl-CoA dehydrogenase